MEQNERLAKLETSQIALREDVNFIKLQVSNHIPTSIRELSNKLDNVVVFVRGVEENFTTEVGGFEDKFAEKRVQDIVYGGLKYILIAVLGAILTAAGIGAFK